MPPVKGKLVECKACKVHIKSGFMLKHVSTVEHQEMKSRQFQEELIMQQEARDNMVWFEQLNRNRYIKCHT